MFKITNALEMISTLSMNTKPVGTSLARQKQQVPAFLWSALVGLQRMFQCIQLTNHGTSNYSRIKIKSIRSNVFVKSVNGSAL